MTIIVNGLAELTADLEQAAVKALPALAAVAEKAGVSLQAKWRANAKATAKKHGRWYPSSITHETKVTAAAVTVEVGPETGKKQGGMGRGFEYGSVKQPPHLDGKKAADAVEPDFTAACTAAATSLL